MAEPSPQVLQAVRALQKGEEVEDLDRTAILLVLTRTYPDRFTTWELKFIADCHAIKGRSRRNRLTWKQRKVFRGIEASLIHTLTELPPEDLKFDTIRDELREVFSKMARLMGEPK